MQGLYPPLQPSSNYTFIHGLSELANGSNIIAPLNGYQYPQIQAASSLDPNSIWISGQLNCPLLTSAINQYWATPEYASIQSTTAKFYAHLQSSVLHGVFPDASIGYFDAFYIWDYLNYAVTHNSSLVNHISDEDLSHARLLADGLVYATYGDLGSSGKTTGDQIRAISGKTLATRILNAFYENIHSQGVTDKMTLLFGHFEPMVAFAALSGLSSKQNPQFYGIPDYGSSMVFELYSVSENSSGSYPSASDLNVRFLYRNGTGENAELVSYPLFGRDPGQVHMTLNEFVAGIEKFMMSSVEEWCRTCDSYSVFCPASRGSTGSGLPPASSSVPLPHPRLKPAVAGIIGAVVSLVVVSLVAVAAMLLGGLRFFRLRKSRRSELSGFKGGEKLASDPDLTIGKDGIGATMVHATADHERVGSWELDERRGLGDAQVTTLKSSDASIGRSSFEEDDLPTDSIANPVRAHDLV